MEVCSKHVLEPVHSVTNTFLGTLKGWSGYSVFTYTQYWHSGSVSWPGM